MSLLMSDTKIPDGSTVVQRIGLVCWWLGVSFSSIFVLIGLLLALNDLDPEYLVLVAFGIFLWLCGRGLLFIMTSR